MELQSQDCLLEDAELSTMYQVGCPSHGDHYSKSPVSSELPGRLGVQELLLCEPQRLDRGVRGEGEQEERAHCGLPLWSVEDCPGLQE